jgi:hypothetical protein
MGTGLAGPVWHYHELKFLFNVFWRNIKNPSFNLCKYYLGENAVDQSLVQGLQSELETRGSPSWKDMFERTSVPTSSDMAAASDSLDKSMVPNSTQFAEVMPQFLL